MAFAQVAFEHGGFLVGTGTVFEMAAE